MIMTENRHQFKTKSMDTVLARPPSVSTVVSPRVDIEEQGDTATTPAPRANIPSWYRGLHQSLRTLSQSGLELDDLDEDDDEDDTEKFGK